MVVRLQPLCVCNNTCLQQAVFYNLRDGCRSARQAQILTKSASVLGQMGTVDVELDLPNSDTWDTLHPGGLPVLQRPTAGEKRYARGGKFIVRIRPAPALTDSPLEVHYALCADGAVQDSLTDGIKLYERGIERPKVLVEDLPSGAVTHPTFFDLVDGCVCFSQYLCFSKFSRRSNYRLRVVVKHGDWQCVGFSGAFKVHNASLHRDRAPANPNHNFIANPNQSDVRLCEYHLTL